MSDAAVFVIGFGTFLLLLGGLVFTVLEIPRSNKPGATKG